MDVPLKTLEALVESRLEGAGCRGRSRSVRRTLHEAPSSYLDVGLFGALIEALHCPARQARRGLGGQVRRADRARHRDFSLEDALAIESLLSSFEIGEVGALALLFWTGYLTVHGAESRAKRAMYGLGYPDCEVRQQTPELDYGPP